jgi:hypothetical protein
MTGRGMLVAAPWLMKFLSVAGTAAMFLVGGAIFVHNIPPLYAAMKELVAGAGSPFGLATALEGAAGLVLGALVLAVVEGFKTLRR